MTLPALVAAGLGGLFGFLADRLAARWPAHADGRVRGPDWRTLGVVVAGAGGFGALAVRWAEARDLVVLGIFLAALLVLLATDLAQKLLPDLITLSLIPYALAILALDLNPLLADTSMPLLVGLATGLGAPALLLVTDRLFKGGLGMGDVKLAVSLGLMCGASRLLTGFLVASLVSSTILIALMALGRLDRRSAIPFGPILIAAGVAAMLA